MVDGSGCAISGWDARSGPVSGRPHAHLESAAYAAIGSATTRAATPAPSQARRAGEASAGEASGLALRARHSPTSTAAAAAGARPTIVYLMRIPVTRALLPPGRARASDLAG